MDYLQDVELTELQTMHDQYILIYHSSLSIIESMAQNQPRQTLTGCHSLSISSMQILSRFIETAIICHIRTANQLVFGIGEWRGTDMMN